MIINDPTKSNESKAQQVPLNSFLYQIFEWWPYDFGK
jgi:hypothetical protein